jgi:RHS repeat-associated protein
MQIKERTWSSSSYKHGFNGMEKDDEVKGEGNSLDFGARIYDSRLGRFLSTDPLFKDFASFSPYVFAQNNPIALIDKNGEAGIDPRWEWYKSEGTSVIKAVSNIQITKTVTVTRCEVYKTTKTQVITTTSNEANKFKGLYVLAQRRMENGFDPTPPGNNPMNIKGSGDDGQINYPTTERLNGRKVSMNDNFANFTTLEEGYQGYFKLLESNFPNAYNSLTDDNKTGQDFAKGLMNGKLGVYATAENYDKDFISMLKGVVSDYEKMYNNRLQDANQQVDFLNKKLSDLGAEGQNSEKAKSLKGQISELNNEITAIKQDQAELQEFKKNEGL